MGSVVYIYTSKRIDAELQNLCRDEDCEVEGVHLAGSCSKMRRSRIERIQCIQAKKKAWAHRQGHSHRALDHAIALAVSGRRIKPFMEVYQEVIDDYGQITERSVYRRLKELIGRGHILRVTFARNLSGYLRPKSPLLADLTSMQEQLLVAQQGAIIGDDDEPTERRRHRRTRVEAQA